MFLISVLKSLVFLRTHSERQGWILKAIKWESDHNGEVSSLSVDRNRWQGSGPMASKGRLLSMEPQQQRAGRCSEEEGRPASVFKVLSAE